MLKKKKKDSPALVLRSGGEAAEDCRISSSSTQNSDSFPHIARTSYLNPGIILAKPMTFWML